MRTRWNILLNKQGFDIKLFNALLIKIKNGWNYRKMCNNTYKTLQMQWKLSILLFNNNYEESIYFLNEIQYSKIYIGIKFIHIWFASDTKQKIGVEEQ